MGAPSDLSPRVPEDNQWLRLWSNPISNDNPYGEDISFSDEFDLLESEIAKSHSAFAKEPTDWSVVLKAGTDILATQSKDIWCLVYSTQAVFHVHGLEEYIRSVEAFALILEEHWTGLYPSLATHKKRRLAALKWLQGKMEQDSGSMHLPVLASNHVARFQRSLERLQTFLITEFENDTPTPLNIFKAELEKALAPPPPSGAKANQPVDINLSSLTGSLKDMDKDGRIPAPVLPQLIRLVIDHSRQLARHYLSIDPLDERAYSLNRAAMWSTLLQAPPVDEQGKTQLNIGITRDRLILYRTAVEEGRYGEILPHLESSAANSPYWLEGQYLIARCLEAQEAHAALASVRNALAQLCKRFPSLLSSSFKDGTPFAPEETLLWLETLEHSTADAGSADMGKDASPGQSHEEALLLQKAYKAKATEGFEAGLRILGAISPARNRAAVRHKLLLAKYCLKTGKRPAAEQLLQGLYNQLEKWNLLEWEPELSAEILALLIKSQTRRKTEPSEGMLLQLHWLDLDTALSLKN